MCLFTRYFSYTRPLANIKMRFELYKSWTLRIGRFIEENQLLEEIKTVTMKYLFFTFYSVVKNKNYSNVKRDQRALIMIYSFFGVLTLFLCINLIIVSNYI